MSLVEITAAFIVGLFNIVVGIVPLAVYGINNNNLVVSSVSCITIGIALVSLVVFMAHGVSHNKSPLETNAIHETPSQVPPK